MDNSPILLTIPLNRPPLQPLNAYKLPLQNAKDSVVPISPVTHAPDLSRRQSILSQNPIEEDFQPIFDNLFTSLFPFEQNYQKLTSKVYIIIAIVLLYLLLWLKEAFLLELSYAQVSFTGIMVASLVNCVLAKVCLPGGSFIYRHNAFKVKRLMALIIAIPILLFHGLQFVDAVLAAGVMCSAFFIVMLIESTFSDKDYSIYEILLGITAFIGVLFISLDVSTGNYEDRKVYKLYGAFVVSLSALCLAGVLVMLTRIQEENFGKTSRSTALILSVVLLVSFMSKQMILPTLFQWCVIASMGIIITVGVLLIIRSIQLEGAGKNLLYIFSYIACGCLSKHLFESPQRGVALWGSIMTLLCLIVHALITGIEKRTVVKSRGYRLRTTTTFEMVEIHSEAYL